jgi:hypothetical protein
MAQVRAIRASLVENATVRRWISRTFVVSILAYLVVIGWLVADAVTGASKWAPYGVNIPAFIALIIASEVAITATAVWIFREDSGIWPASISQGWAGLRRGRIADGLKRIAFGAWDISLIDLRLRTRRAIYLGRLNRVAALVPLAYALTASAGGAPWGLRSSALIDVGLTLGVWAFMEAVMVQPPAPARAVAADGAAVLDRVAEAATATQPAKTVGAGRQQSHYEVRQVRLEDVDRIEEIERLKWREQAATREMILARLHAYPEGQLAAIHVRTVDGLPSRSTIVAWFTGMAASERRIRSLATWDQVTSSGTLREADRKGNVLVGVNLTSVTEGAIYMLGGEFLVSVVMLGKSKLIGVGRLNGFISFNEHRRAEGKTLFTPDQYARLREVRGYRLNEAGIDIGLPPLEDAMYLSIVARLRAERGEPPLVEDEAPDYVCSNLREYMSLPGARIVEVLANYFPDPASANYGVLVEGSNPLPALLRHVPWVKRWAAARIRREVQAEWKRRQERLRERSRRRTAERIPEFLRKGAEEDTAPGRGDGRPEVEAAAGGRGPIPPAAGR